jgi:hypothetical protein
VDNDKRAITFDRDMELLGDNSRGLDKFKLIYDTAKHVGVLQDLKEVISDMKMGEAADYENFNHEKALDEYRH